MTLSESEELLPLINHNRSNQEALNVECQSPIRFNKRTLTKSDLNENLPLLESSNNYQSIADFSGQSLTYSWNNLSVFNVSENEKKFWGKAIHVAQPKQILKNVYGVAYPGEFLAIMGASGAGKTTVLNALTFQTGPYSIVKGSRRLNGLPVIERDSIARVSAYVEQENLFLGTLSVKEHLIFQSLLRMDGDVPYYQKLKRVEDVINELGLEKCQNTIIGYEGRIKGISGGERKRLSFASEILTNPSIMFCDEPTSGLDSFMALNVINVLKSMAIRGKTVICTIHQPSSEMFSLFDKILLLAEGRTAFLGKPNEAISFFTELGATPPANYNPADFFIQMLAVVPNREEISKNTIASICNFFDQSPQGLEIVTKIECAPQNRILKVHSSDWRRYITTSDNPSRHGEYTAGWFCQFGALFRRSWINMTKEPILVKVRLFQTLVLSLIVGLIYQGQKLNENGVININGVLFTFLTNMTFQNLFAVISVFCSELPIFLKEYSNRLYRVDTYFLSKTLAELPIFLAIPIIFTCITYYWINLNSGLYHFAFTILILVLVTNVATSFGYFISCISTNAVMALSIGPPVIIPFLLFGGFLLSAGAIPAYFKWLSYLSWFKYGNEALLINQWSDIKNIECNASAITCPKNGDIVLEIYHFDKKNFWWDLGSLFILIILFRFFAFLALFVKARRAQRTK